MDLKPFDKFWIGLMCGLMAYSVLLADQYGFSFMIIREGFWSIAQCLKPQTLIIYPSFAIVYYMFLGPTHYRTLKSLGLVLLSFVLQDSAYMFFYSPIFSTSALARNILVFYVSLFMLVKSNLEIHLARLTALSLLSLGLLWLYTNTLFNADMTLSDFVLKDSLLKLIPSALILPAFKRRSPNPPASPPRS